MRILRSVTRRGFNIGTAGWFDVLRPNTWFPASRLPDSFSRYGNRARPRGPFETGMAQGPALHSAAPRENAIPLHVVNWARPGSSHLRTAMILVAAAVITAGVLLWIMFPR